MRVGSIRVVLAAVTAVVTGIAPPSEGSEMGSVECSSYPPGDPPAPGARVCRESRQPGHLDDCFRVTVNFPTLGPTYIEDCP